MNAPDMPQMMLLPTADIIQRLPLDGAVIGTFEYCPVCSLFEPQACFEAIRWLN